MKQQYELKDTIIYLDEVELGYGSGSDYKCILKNITLEEKDVVRENCITGQNIAIVGRSGRGKSTLFRALTGLMKPKSGRILLIDQETDAEAKEVKEGDIGFVDQKYTLFRNKTVKEALYDAQRKDKITKKEKLEIIDRYVNDWGLVNQIDQYPCELSGGQRQRVAIIEQILSSGNFMVMDEPFSGLDVGNIQSVKNAFKLIHGDHELNTIIFSTHDIALAVELADSIYILGKEDLNDQHSTIVSHIDLKERGIAWSDEFTPAHLAVQKEIENIMMNS